MLKIKDLKTLRKLTVNNKEGELAVVEETRTLYQWDGKNWCIYKPPGGNLGISLYELNQSAITALPPLSEENITAISKTIADFVKKYPKGRYYMLLSNEQKYYTLFSVGYATGTAFDYEPIENEVIACLKSQGTLKDYSEVENGLEFWVTKEDNSYVYYLFNYDEGVIKCQ